MTYLALFPGQKCQIAILGITKRLNKGIAWFLTTLFDLAIPQIANGINNPVLRNQNQTKSHGLFSHEDFPSIQRKCQLFPSRSGHCQITIGIPIANAGQKNRIQYCRRLIAAQINDKSTPAKMYVPEFFTDRFSHKKTMTRITAEKPISVGL